MLAIGILAVYERAVTRSGRTTSGRTLSLGAAAFAASVTVVAFDIGMVMLHFNDLMPPVTEGSFWFIMQVGVIVGLATGYPAVRWLLVGNESVVPA